MPLDAGARFGPYEIVAPLGVGGMGAVYRARDSRLKRDVAIKVLLDEVAADPDRLARFQREAEALAALNHPNIAAIYAVEGAALVLELVEGPTLADRIAQGPIPAEEALELARQLIDALEYAHERGIVHRDLKPANIKLSAGGAVKVLDFGLAKALGNDSVAGDPKSSPTMTMRATLAGTILGTAAYMSPEQARGQNVDKRADIWSFGVIVYEMLSGGMPFDAPTVSDTLALVLTKTPEIGDLPERFRPLVARCLERDARRRLRDIGDARILLESTAVKVVTTRSRVPAVVAGVAALGLAAAAGLAWMHFRETAPPAAPVKFEIAMPDKVALRNTLAVSPDGRRIAFVAAAAGGAPAMIWVRSLDSLESRPLAGTEWANFVAWSPDSKRLVFNSLALIHLMDAAGGGAESVCDSCMDAYSTAAWLPGGDFLLGTNGGIVRVSGHGAPAVLVPPTLSGRVVYPLRDGKHFLYSRSTIGDINGHVYMGAIGGAPPTADAPPPLLSVSGVFQFTEDDRQGYVLFARDGGLVAQRLDTSKLQVMGEAAHVADHVLAFGASPSVLVYRAGSAGALNSRLVWRNRQGKEVGTVGAPAGFGSMALTPDAKTVVADQVDNTGISHVWTGDVARGVFSRADASTGPQLSPAIAPDGSLAFSFSPGGMARNLYVMPKGAGAPEKRVESVYVKHPNHISADGRYLIYDEHHGAEQQDLWVLPLQGEATPVPFLTTRADETHGQFSPDSRWVAYSTDESGRREVQVRAFLPGQSPAGGAQKWVVSTAGGDKPRWSRDGKELFYLAPDGNMMAVPVKTAGGFEPGIPVALFATRTTGYLPYDVSPDGRFLINTPVEDAAAVSNAITVVLNWTAVFQRSRDR